MATKEQFAKRIEIREKRLAAKTPKLDELNEKVAKFDERMKELREKLTARRDRMQKTVTTLTREIEWYKNAPVNGVDDGEPDEPVETDDEGNSVETDEPVDDGTESDDETDDDTDSGDETDEPVTTGRQRDERGHFVSASA